MPGQDPGAGTSVTLANETQDAGLSIDDVTTHNIGCDALTTAPPVFPALLVTHP